MERVTSYVEARHFRIGDLYAFGISVAIEFATDRKGFFCRGVGDQRDCDVEAHPGITRPADPIEPEPNAVEGEFPGIMVDSN